MTIEHLADFTSRDLGNHLATVSAGEMSRRKFLARCAVGALPGLLAACQGGSSGVGNPTPSSTRQLSPTSNATPSPTRQPSPTAADWAALARSLQGTLVRPGSSQYPTALQLFNTLFDSVQPVAIAYCASPMDVQTCLSFAHRFGLPLVPRSGGHSYAGYSTTTGLLLDVTRMSMVTVNSGAGTATVGAGARLIDVYAALAQHGLTIPAGSCATVGVAGLTLGGGVGVLGRKFGLTCDNLLSAQVILADGRLLTCDAKHDPDLFWALRGGGGGNFGVVTSFTFQTHPVATLSLFTIGWPWRSASAVFDTWQTWAPQAPDELWSNFLLLATKNKSSGPIVRVNGVYVGSVASLNPLLQQLTSRISTAPTYSNVSGAGLLDTMLVEAGCYGKSVDECHLPSQNPQGQLSRDTFGAKSDYFTATLPRPAIDALVSAVARRQASSILGEGGIGIDAFGGAINRVAPDATAFVHRNALFSAQYSASWNPNDPASVVAANHSWLTSTWQAMRQYASGAAYQN
ncbi:MAG: FAD-binding oxidoreductase, partial [Ktedonobacterales bacterium]